MTSADFIAEADRTVLHAHGLADFDALWAYSGAAVDAPNTGRGGISTVYHLQLGDHRYYLKRQRGHLTRSVRHPWGEATFAREWRNIQRYQRLRLATLEVAFFGVRGRARETRAILLTRALTDFTDLDSLLARWHDLPAATRSEIVRACAELARRLHAAGVKHGCFYPKHIFLQRAQDGWHSCVIDLEKSRSLLPWRADRIADIEPLLRRMPVWGEAETRAFLHTYLGASVTTRELESWFVRLAARRHAKEQR